MKNRGYVEIATLVIGALVLLLATYALLFVVVGQKATSQREKYAKEEQELVKFIRMCSDNELVSKYYEIDSKLQIALDELNIAQGGATREAISNIGSKYKIYTGGISIAFAKKKVEYLRKMRAILLTEVYKRELKIPK